MTWAKCSRESSEADGWAECEATVKGQSGARFKKCRGPEEEAIILDQWGVRQEENG